MRKLIAAISGRDENYFDEKVDVEIPLLDESSSWEENVVEIRHVENEISSRKRSSKFGLRRQDPSK